MSKKNLKRVGVGLLSVPLGFLALFTFGEVFSGDLSGLSHLIQAAPIILLILLAFKKPFIAGVILMVVSIGLGIVYILRTPFGVMTILLVELFLFIPPLISGILLILSSRK